MTTQNDMALSNTSVFPIFQIELMSVFLHDQKSSNITANKNSEIFEQVHHSAVTIIYKTMPYSQSYLCVMTAMYSVSLHAVPG